MVVLKGIQTSIGLRKGLPITPFLKYQLNRLRDSGILKNQLARYEAKDPSCPIKEKFVQISLKKMIFLFALILIGAIFSTIIFLVEKILAKRKKIFIALGAIFILRKDIGVGRWSRKWHFFPYFM